MYFIPQDKIRSSPLGAACEHNHPQIAQLLMSKSADINYQDNVCNYDFCFNNIIIYDIKFCFSLQYGNTPLHWGSLKGYPEVVKILVQSQPNLNIKNKVSTES